MEELIQRVAGKAVIKSPLGVLVLHPSEVDANRLWHIPGGIRDDIDEALLDTCLREVREETGLELKSPLGVLRIGEWKAVDKGEKVKILAVFYHFLLDEMPEIKLSHEHDQYAWLNLKNYKEYQANSEVYEIIEQLYQ